MNGTLTVLHLRNQPPLSVEQALSSIFAGEGREQRLRLEGSYSAVLARLTAPTLDASYRYLICRPHSASAWTPVLELGNRTDGLDVELSKALVGCDVITTFVFGEVFSGYRAARGGKLLDQYASDPTYYAEETAEGAPPVASDIADLSGHPQAFVDLFPADTTPEDFSRVVLRPGYWERLVEPAPDAADAGEDDDIVDEVDRMRCIALALELWGPEEYPFARELDEIPNQVVGPVIALAFA
ncbi:MAG TPA: hypothetical protein VF120_04040 [Ktedonobacterales bacterium]